MIDQFRSALWAIPIVVLMTHENVAFADTNDKIVAQGSKLYARECAVCHGANLEGQPNWRRPNADGILPAPPHDDTGHTWHHGDQLLFDYTKLGGEEALRRVGVTGVKSGMPGFGEHLSDDDIWAILEYIRSNWSERSKKAQQERTEAERAASRK